MIERLSVALDFGDGEKPLQVGQLGRDIERRSIAFEWDAEFAASPLPLSPVLCRSYDQLLRPNSGRRASLPSLFEDSLPDGWGRLLLDREIVARGISRTKIGDIERLAYVGRYGSGALTYAPETDTLPNESIDLGWFEEIIPQVMNGASAADLSRLRVMSGGSQGARPKFVAQINDDMHSLRDYRLPLASGWTQVLIKGRASSDPVGTVEAEIAYGILMREAGIKVCRMFPLEGHKESFFGTDRFDRPGRGRLHMSTVAGLLDTGMQHGVVDYVDLIKLSKIMCGRIDVVEEVFRRMVFNVRALNRDDHVRNHAFLMNAAAEWSLAPAYDVSFSAGPGGEHSISIAGDGRYPGKGAINEVARVAGIKPVRRDQIIDAVDSALCSWEEVAGNCGVPDFLIEDIGSEMVIARGWK